MPTNDSSSVSFNDLGGDRIDRRTAIELFGAAGLMSLAGCTGDGNVTPQSGGSGGGGGKTTPQSGDSSGGGVLNVAESQGNVKTLDPQQCSTDICYRIIQYVHTGLVDVNRNFEIIPGLAKSWKTPNDTTIVFNIRKNAKWHNGDDFTADDWVYTLKRNRSKKYQSLYNTELNPIKQAVAEDDYSLRMDLKKPYAPLFAYLTPVGRAGIPVNKNAVERSGDKKYNYGNNPNHIVGTGPFKLDEWNSRSNLKLSIFDDYWGEAPSIDGVKIELIDDANALTNALLSGAAHIVPSLPTPQVKALKDSNNISIFSNITGNYHYISMNTNREPFDNVKVRQAIMLAIDREAAVEAVFQGLAQPNGYTMSPVFKWAYPDEKSFQQHDPERAKKLLKEAGYPDGFKTEFLTPNLQPWNSAGKWLSQELQKVGIQANLKVMEWAAFREKTASPPFEYDLFNLQWVGDIDPDQEVGPLGKNSGLNRTNYNDKKATKLIEKQRQAQNQDKRGKILKKLLRYVDENGPYAVFATQKRSYGVSNKVKGFKPHPAMYIPATEVSLKSN